MRGAVHVAGACLLALASSPAFADVGDYLGKPIASVTVEREGRPQTDPRLLEIIETKADAPLSMVAVRASVARLFALGRFEDVRVHAETAGSGVRLMYELVPVHPVDKIQFIGIAGVPGIDGGRLRRDIVQRFGISPPIGRLTDMVRIVEDDLRVHGYRRSTITPRADLQHDPDRATLVFVIAPGARTSIGAISIAGASGLSESELLKQLRLRRGMPYESDTLDERIARYIADRRSRGFLEARLSATPRFSEDERAADLTLDVSQGPRVQQRFEGDALPSNRLKDLVPIEREGSADEDLLEDSTRRIEDYLRAQGYRDASAPHRRETVGDELRVTFTIARGARYRIADVKVAGITAPWAANLEAALRVRTGQPFSDANLDADVAAIRDLYRRQGYAAATVDAIPATPPRAPGAADVPVSVTIDVTESVQTLVGDVRMEGNSSVPDADLTKILGLAPGRPFFVNQLAQDRDAIQQHYVEVGFPSATVEARPGLNADRTRADIVFSILEGPRLFVDQIFIDGNVRTNQDTIKRELQFKEGDALGTAAIDESQRRLASLGLFRRTTITSIGHGESTRDVLITVEEAPRTTIGFGGGMEVQQRTVQNSGVAGQRLEVAPRGFFSIGRRNLFGKNRSVDLFTRLSLLPKDSLLFQGQETPPSTGGQFGFPEYRILGTFREPHVFGTPADAVLTGVLEQQIRSSFDFARRSINADVGRRLTRDLSLSGNYSIQRIRIFNQPSTPTNDQTLIDRLFPQVVLSSFSSAIVRNTKDDALDPTTGTYLSASGQLAARAIGSEVGFLKSYLRGQLFHTVSRSTRVVLATNATLGLAQGLPRDVVQADGSAATIRELPASERFFAGGDDGPVRGFGLDQLGAGKTIDENGFAIGGNALLVLNAELRAPYRNFELVGFFDTGNVFARPSDIDLGQLRSAVGFGIRYKSLVGPIRVDLGFKTHLDEIPCPPSATDRCFESRPALHISLGQAF